MSVPQVSQQQTGKSLLQSVTKHKERKGRNIGVLELLLIFTLALLGVWAFLVYDMLTFSTPKIYTCTPDQPLYITKPNFFDENTFEGIKDRLSFGELSDVPNALDGTNFGGTTGILLQFNLEGYETFKSHPKLQDLVAFFDRIKLNNTNAFVVNVLASVGEDSDAALDDTGAAYTAGEHVDNTLYMFEMRFKSHLEFVSHQTTVLYVSIPDDMEGGKLRINPTRVQRHLQKGLNAQNPGQDATGQYSGPALELTRITPQENMMVSFRGDALHTVEAFRTPIRGARRISLVVEQYMVPSRHYWRTKKFWSSQPL